MKFWTPIAAATLLTSACAGDPTQGSVSSGSLQTSHSALAAQAPTRVAVYWGSVAAGSTKSRVDWNGSVGVENATIALSGNHALEADDLVTVRSNSIGFRSATTGDTDGVVVTVSGSGARLTVSGRSIQTTVISVDSLGCGPTRVRRTDGAGGQALLVQKSCPEAVEAPSAEVEVAWGRTTGTTQASWSWRLGGVEAEVTGGSVAGESSDSGSMRTGEYNITSVTASDLDAARIRITAPSWADASAASLCATINGAPGPCWAVSELLCRTEQRTMNNGLAYRISGQCGTSSAVAGAFAGSDSPSWYPDPTWFVDPAASETTDFAVNPSWYPDPTWAPVQVAKADWYPDPTW